MTNIASIRVNDEQDVVVGSAYCLDAALTIVTTIIRSFECWTRKNACRVIKTKPSFTKVAMAFCIIPLEDYDFAWYAISVYQSMCRQRRKRV